MNEQVQAWVKRNNRKKARLIEYSNGVYHIVYSDRGKVRIGTVKDGMHTRYGISAHGAMASESVLSLWQSGPNAVSEQDVAIMQAYHRGECNLPEFDFGTIQGLQE